jgi:hypothetical protein
VRRNASLKDLFDTSPEHRNTGNRVDLIFFSFCANLSFKTKIQRTLAGYIKYVPAELIKAGSSTICGEIHKLIISIWDKEKLPEE